MGEGSKKCRVFRMCFYSNNYQFKTSRYGYKSTYMKNMVTTNQKTTKYAKTRAKGTQI